MKNYQIRIVQTIAGRREVERGIIPAISSKEAMEKTIKMVSHNASFVKTTVKRYRG